MKRVFHCCQNIVTVIITVSVKVRSKTIVKITLLTVVDPGVGPGGPGPPLLIFRPNWGPKGQKIFVFDTAPPFSKGLDDNSPPPFLTIWIWHWLNRKSNSCSTSFKWQKGQIWRFSGVFGTVCLPVSVSKRWLLSLNLFGVNHVYLVNHWDLNYCIGY